MRLTDRDRTLLTDLALHHVMTRTQIMRLGYFGSMQRANAKLLKLRKAGLIRQVLMNPSLPSREFLYAVSKPASSFLDGRIASLLAARKYTPRFVDHALSVVDVRIKLRDLGFAKWFAEAQVRHRYSVSSGVAKRIEEFRPDGAVISDKAVLFVEVDRGNVSLPRMKDKLSGYGKYVNSGLFASIYGALSPSLLIVTTGNLRLAHIERLKPFAQPVAGILHTFDSFSTLPSLDLEVQP